jgi:hypothetical protein
MRTWHELETEFRALQPSQAFQPRLDHQGGDAGEYWDLAGVGSPQERQRFEALARMAGTKLLDVPGAESVPHLVQERDPVTRWYRALQHSSGAYRSDHHAIMKDSAGQDAGIITGGSIDRVYEASAALCVALESVSALPSCKLEVLSSVPRYQAPYEHWQAARASLSAETPDHAVAVHEAIKAIEAMSCIVLRDNAVTLGSALQRMRQQDMLHPALAAALEKVWGFASVEPGVRHGKTSPPAPKVAEVRFVVDVCEAALLLLLAIDRPVP